MRSWLGVSAVALLLAAPPALSRSLDDIKQRGVISVCAHPNALPFASRRGPVRGIQIDLAQEIAARLGVALEVEWVTLGSQYRAVDCDLVMDAIVDEGALQERNLKWSTPYQRSGVALALRGDRTEIERFEDLGPEARIGVQLGSVAQWLLGQKGLRAIPFGFEDEMVAALGAGEIDAAAATATSIGWYNHEHRGAELVIIHVVEHDPELVWDVAVGMRRSDRFLRREIDRIVEAMVSDGAVARVYADYGVEHRPPVTRKPVLVQRKSRLGEEGCIRLGNSRECSAEPQ